MIKGLRKMIPLFVFIGVVLLIIISFIIFTPMAIDFLNKSIEYRKNGEILKSIWYFFLYKIFSGGGK